MQFQKNSGKICRIFAIFEDIVEELRRIYTVKKFRKSFRKLPIIPQKL